MSAKAWPVLVMALMAGDRATRRWPGLPQAATLAHGRLGHGTAATVASATTRAAGELIEIASCCAWGDEPLIDATPAEMGAEGWGRGLLAGFSVDQVRGRVGWNRRLAGLDWIPAPVDPQRPIAWIGADCPLGGSRVFVPADSVLIGRREMGDPQAVAVADTNGCAAGETAETALLSAVYELVERDATGRWWYGQDARPVLDGGAHPALRDALHARGRQSWLLDITSDLGIPTVAALATNPGGAQVCAGFATRSTLAAAAEAALCELLQMELRRVVALAHPGQDTAMEAWLHGLTLGDGAPFHAQDKAVQAHPVADLAPGATACLRHLAACGVRIATLDRTRPEFDVPVIRAISPDLCHWKPRFGRSRLLSEHPSGSGQKHLESRPLLRM